MSNIVPLQMQFDDRQVEIMRRTIAKDVPPEEFAFFLEVARSKGLNPFNREIYPVMRKGRLTIQVGIDGFRKKADESGMYLGQEGPYFCGKDGVWRDSWIEDAPPVAVKVGILRSGFAGPIWAIARYKSYVQTDRDGHVTETWAKLPDVLLSKCAEALGLRKTFPGALSGVYIPEEMMQADVLPRQAKVKAPTSREMCAKGLDAGLWTDTDGYYRFALGVIGRDLKLQGAEAPTTDERILIDVAIDEAIIKRQKPSVVVESVPEPEIVPESVESQPQGDTSGPITAPQLTSIEKLYARLGREFDVEAVKLLTFNQAKEQIAGLSLEYRKSKNPNAEALGDNVSGDVSAEKTA